MNTNSPAPCATRPPLEANTGIRLLSDPDSADLIVQPLTRAPAGLPPYQMQPRFPLPKLPSSLMEQTAGVTRAFWRRHRCSLTMLLYLDIRSREWEAWVPNQFCSPCGGRFNLDFQNLGPPEDHLRLSGSIRSLPCPDLKDAADAAPPFEGLHVVADPSRDWLSLRAFFRVGGDLRPVPLDSVALDQCDEEVDRLLDRVWLVDRL